MKAHEFGAQLIAYTPTGINEGMNEYNPPLKFMDFMKSWQNVGKNQVPLQDDAYGSQLKLGGLVEMVKDRF